MDMYIAAKLDAIVKAATAANAIIGVSIGDPSDKTTWCIDFSPNATDQQKTAATAALTTFDPSAISKNDVVNERERRLALGFNYDFGDSRGVHHIGTTPEDMVGWAEVNTYASALIESGDSTTKITIATDTGLCQVTAPEWKAIELAAAAFRQPLWAKSFQLMASSPIPQDFANDAHWS